MTLKYNLTDDELQELSDKLRKLIDVEFREEIGNIPDHIKDALCQNYVIQCKENKCDLNELLNKHKIVIEEKEDAE